MINFQRISIALLDPNTGQIPGVPKNPRKWGRRELQNLANSMKDTPELTEARGCIVAPWLGRFVVLGGNMRLAAAKAHLDWTELMCAVLPEGTSADRMREIVQKDNSSFGQFDYDILRKEWLGFGYDYQSWGLNFDTKELELEPEEAKDDNFDVDRALEGIKKTRSQRGDIWQLGDHYLMCGDSTSAEDMEKLMDGAKADLIITDSPYNVDYEGGNGKKIQNDNMSDNKFLNFLTDAFRTMLGVLKNGGAFYIWHADSEGYNFRQAVKNCKGEIRQCLIWVKNSLVLGRQDYQWRHEPCLYGWKAGAGHYWEGRRDLSTVFDETRGDWPKMSKDQLIAELKRYDQEVKTTIIYEDKPKKSDEHPTMKPVRLFERLMLNSSKAEDIVLDPFGGSGTTIITAAKTGRYARVMELDPHYADVIRKRWTTWAKENGVEPGPGGLE